MDKNQPTLSGPGSDLDAAANIMKTAWQQLSSAETQLRLLVVRARSGVHITGAGAAAVVRGAADMLAECSSKLHEAARRIEPPSVTGVTHIRRKTPRG